MSRSTRKSGRSSKEVHLNSSHPFNRYLATPPVKEVLITPIKLLQTPLKEKRVAILGTVGGSALSGQHRIAVSNG